MFLFARGFEAATLKIPASTAAARERDAAAAAAVSAIAATLPSYSPSPSPAPLDPNQTYGFTTPSTAANSYDQFNQLSNPLYEEAFHAASSAELQSGSQTQQVEGAHRVSHALAAAALSASASTGNLASQTNRKQIIGFAKFRSRDDAMEARDMLSGKKIDVEKGCILKAEMAKKNLHTKRSATDPLPVEPPHPAPLRSRPSVTALDRLAAREFDRDSVVALELSGGLYRERRDERELRIHQEQESHYALEVEKERSARARLQASAAYDAFHSVPVPPETAALFHNATSLVPDRRSSLSQMEVSESYAAGRPHERSASHPVQLLPASPSMRSLSGTSDFGKTLLQQLDADEDIDLPRGSPSTGFEGSAYPSRESSTSRRRLAGPAVPPTDAGMSIRSYGGQTYIDEDFRRLAMATTPTAITGPAPLPPPLSRPLSPTSDQQHLTLASATTPTTAAFARRFATPFASPDISPTYTDLRIPRTQNRADDNLPISTLYVGGLPAVLPNLTGPMSATFLEESLRNIFSRCAGFKRLSYRQKSQGCVCVCVLLCVRS